VRRSTRAKEPIDRLGELVSNEWCRHASTTSATHLPRLPRTFEEAQGGPDSQYWQAAIEEQLNDLIDFETWKEVVSLPPGAKALDSKWTFTIKDNIKELPVPCKWSTKEMTNGTYERYKARLVVRGDHQREGIDYGETYAPVVRPEMIRIGAAIAVSADGGDIEFDGMDAVSAFLNGPLAEDIHMKTPKGLKARCRFVKLLKAMYGLRQAPRSWHKVVDTFVVETLKFTRVKSTTCVYIKREANGRFVIIFIYVDDVGFIGHRELIAEAKAGLSARFKMVDLGRMKKCIGIEMDRGEDGSMFLHQRHYATQILETFNLTDSKPQHVPAKAGSRLSKSQCPQNEAERQAVNKKHAGFDYRACVGYLIYYLHTRPDMYFGVGEVARFMDDP
jgi:hypothetical protein